MQSQIVDVDLGVLMKTSALPRTSSSDVIATCRFALLADKVTAGDVDVDPRFTGSTVGCRPTASLCYAAYSFPSKQTNRSILAQVCSKQRQKNNK